MKPVTSGPVAGELAGARREPDRQAVGRDLGVVEPLQPGAARLADARAVGLEQAHLDLRRRSGAVGEQIPTHDQHARPGAVARDERLHVGGDPARSLLDGGRAEVRLALQAQPAHRTAEQRHPDEHRGDAHDHRRGASRLGVEIGRARRRALLRAGHRNVGLVECARALRRLVARCRTRLGGQPERRARFEYVRRRVLGQRLPARVALVLVGQARAERGVDVLELRILRENRARLGGGLRRLGGLWRTRTLGRRRVLAEEEPARSVLLLLADLVAEQRAAELGLGRAQVGRTGVEHLLRGLPAGCDDPLFGDRLGRRLGRRGRRGLRLRRLLDGLGRLGLGRAWARAGARCGSGPSGAWWWAACARASSRECGGPRSARSATSGRRTGTRDCRAARRGRRARRAARYHRPQGPLRSGAADEGVM